MNKVSEYQVIPGFFDLREFNLPEKVFLKFWRVQEFLHSQEGNKEYLKNFNLIQWRDLQELSARYQDCLFEYRGEVQSRLI